ncbi:hypothetical protein A2125_02635 [Candidatus Woesebacteria bacterium GWB1_43_5]|uniref:Transglycosylase n=1 Tax=Candidatus Woesebacteria bacterium GWB1_43_5 TaxID=1802474 RepID=A0A1F7WTM6_9BACT|nr:MAG: hypothetical protein A2125_02635 [Candidatus Woesebacteria bacterium GWB1_43_5]
MVAVVLLLFGAVVGFGMHFFLPGKFNRLIVDILAGVAGSVIGAIISSPFAPPSDFGQKITFLIASLVGAVFAVSIARTFKV